MYLEIVSPEKVLLSAEVNSVTVPGVEGEFQMLNNHFYKNYIHIVHYI